MADRIGRRGAGVRAVVESRKALQAKLAKLAAENRQLRDRLDGRLIELLVLLEQIEELKRKLS